MLKVLGIESSCDESSASVVTSQKHILSNIVLSQHHDHMPFKGVVPEIAARKHLDNLSYCIEHALEKAQITLSQIDAIGVTSGPGLIGGLIVGLMHARAIAHVTGKPLININHLEGHILTPRLTSDLTYPYIVLLISGGHSQFVSVKGVGQYKILGQSLDDAVGECFDKTAKILGLQYPGGPAIEEMAKSGDPFKYTLPLAMTNKSRADMSFSGLKTATRLLIESLRSTNQDFVADVCASLQHTIAQILTMRAINAIQMLDYVPDAFVLAGGVAANLYIRQYMSHALQKRDISLVAPPVSLCTDNAAMIAWATLERIEGGLANEASYFLNPNLAL